MPRFRATLSAEMNVTAANPSQAESYCRDDGAEFLGENVHTVGDVCEADADDEVTLRLDELTYGASVSSSAYDKRDEDDEDAEFTWDATCTFDAVFEAESLEAAKEMAIGLPFRLKSYDQVDAIAERLGKGQAEVGVAIDRIYVERDAADDVDSFTAAVRQAITGSYVLVTEERFEIVLPPAPGMTPPAPAMSM